MPRELDLSDDDREEYRLQSLEQRALRDRWEWDARHPVTPETGPREEPEQEEDDVAIEAAVDDEQEYRHGIGNRADDEEDAAERRACRDDD